MSVWGRLRRLESEGCPARVAVVGAGYVGRGLVHRLERTPGLRAALVVNRTVRAGVEAYQRIGHDRRHITVSDDRDVLAGALAEGRPAVTASAELVPALEDVDVVVEATGALDHGAMVMLACLEGGKDVVSINAEVDATIGHLLHHVANEHGAVYTISDGDQPGGLLRQIELTEGMGFDVVAAVNCKRHLDLRQTPATSAPYAERDGTSPAVTTSAGDGTKMQVECAVVANVKGLPPDRRGMHGVPTTLDRALEDVLAAVSRRGVVEHTLGGDFGAGVFVIGHAPEHDLVRRQLRFFKMGDGPDYLFFRPHTLVHFEMPLTIAEVVLDHEPLGVPSGPPVAEVIAVAKRDLVAGEALDGIGGFTCYGQIDTVEGAAGLLPIALAEHARLRAPVGRDHPIPRDAVELDEDAAIVGLRRRQERLLGAASVGA
jgi:predicted homoserine dehydrogenase-like protein